MNKSLLTFVLGLGIFASNMVNAVCNPNITIHAKPNGIYIDHANGTVTDGVTGLMWQKCSIGQVYSTGSCGGTVATDEWKAAHGSALTANSGNAYGHSDWRLPNIKELESLIETSCNDPAINLNLFPGTVPTATYWSSSPDNNNPSFAWYVSFQGGDAGVLPKSNLFSVRLVRDNPPPYP